MQDLYPSKIGGVQTETTTGAHGEGLRHPPGARWASAILSTCDRMIGNLASLLLIALVGIVFANVVARYLFNHSLVWVSEAAQWLFVAVIFLAVPIAHRARQHVSIAFWLAKLPAPLMKTARFLADLIVAFTTLTLLFAGMELIDRIGGVNYVLALPVWLKFAVIPLSAGLAMIYLLLRDVEAGESVLVSLGAILGAGLIYAASGFGSDMHLAAISPAFMLLAGFAGALAIGVPVAFAMLFAAILSSAAGGGMPSAAVVQTMVNGSSKFLLLAIPFFIAAGCLMNGGGLTGRLIDLAQMLVGRMRGGLAQVNIVSSTLYAGISGSSYSEAALGTKLLVPHMVRQGYRPEFACAVTASSAIIPNIIPPSIALLILAATANLSVGDLWIAGIVPGLLLAVFLMAAVYLMSDRGVPGRTDAETGGEDGARAGEVATAPRAPAQILLRSLPVLALALFILFGIRFGVVTPTEAGVLAVVYAFVLGVFFYRAYDGQTLWETIRTAAVDAALIGFLIGAAAPFSFMLITQQVPQMISDTVLSLSVDPWMVLLLVNVMLLGFGMFLDIGAAILIFAPLLLPAMAALGIDPVHFGIVLVVNLMLGGLTPPVGMLAFISSTISGTPVHKIFRAVLPLLAALIAGLLVITYLPALSLGLGTLL